MIQRIQTIYLLLAFAALGLMFFFPIVEFTSNQPVPGLPHSSTGAYLDYKVYAFEETADNPLTLVKPDFTALFIENTLAIGVSMIILLVAIGLFNNRKMQKILCWTAVVCMLICVGLIYLHINPEKVATTNRQLGIGAFMLSVALVFTMFARRGIQKDEDLIRSSDRIR